MNRYTILDLRFDDNLPAQPATFGSYPAVIQERVAEVLGDSTVITQPQWTVPVGRLFRGIRVRSSINPASEGISTDGEDNYRLVSVRFHRENLEGMRGRQFPNPNSEWLESCRELIWNESDGRPDNVSIIIYRRDSEIAARRRETQKSSDETDADAGGRDLSNREDATDAGLGERVLSCRDYATDAGELLPELSTGQDATYNEVSYEGSASPNEDPTPPAGREDNQAALCRDSAQGGNHQAPDATASDTAPSVPSISVIISTYNQPRWLEKVLWGYEAQSFMDFEVVIADDGSDRETYLTVQRLAPQLSFPVKHVWISDRGFRKCRILNHAILASSGRYLLFSDGDCIPRRDFVETHHLQRRPRRFLSNGYYKLSMALSEFITREDILSGNCFDIRWLKAQGLPRTFKNNKFTARGIRRRLLNALTPANASWNGHGASCRREDAMMINGFDERMEYGGEDREFGERLENNGIKGRQIRYSTVCIHLDHSRGYVSPEKVEANLAIRKQTRSRKLKTTSFGIYTAEDTGPGVMDKNKL